MEENTLEEPPEGLSAQLQALRQQLAERDTRINQLEEQLTHSQAQFKVLYDSTLVGVAFWNVQGNVQAANDAFLEMMGRTRAELESGTLNWRQVTPPEFGAQDEAKIAEALQNRQPVAPFRKEFIRPNGQRVVALVSGSMLPGSTEEAIAFVFDATSLQQQEKELARTQSRVQGLLDSKMIGIVFSDFQGNFTEVNDAFLHMLGYSRQDVGQHRLRWPDLTPPEYADRDQAAISQMREGGAFKPYEKEYFRKDGSRIPVLVGGSLLPGMEEGCAFVIDNTERQQQAAAVRESEQKFRKLFDASLIGIAFWRADGAMIDANETFLNLIGYSRSELEQGTLNWQRLTPPGYEEVDDRAFKEVQEKGTFTPFTKEYVRSDGSRVAVLLGGAKLEGQLDSVTFVIDVTELGQARQTLEERNRLLEQSNRELEQFAYISSHDLQEPLRTITGFAQLLARKYRGRLEPQADEYLDFITEAASRMKTLILNLLDFSRLGTRQNPLVPTDLNRVLMQTRNSLLGTIRESEATLTSDDLPVLPVDELQIGHLFNQLVSNSLKFRQPGVAPHIHIGARSGPAGFWTFWVQDNGIGLDTQYSAKIFQVFQRLHTRTEYPGTGIGLAMAKKIVERHGGEIWVESEPGQGATFYFTLKS